MLVRSVCQAASIGTQARYMILNDISMRVDDSTHVSAGSCPSIRSRDQARLAEKENRMRTVMAMILAMTASAAMADDLDDAHRLEFDGRECGWECAAGGQNTDD